MTLAKAEATLVAEHTLDVEVAVSHPVIQCDGLSKSYGEESALRDVTLTLEDGEVLALVGPSGSGKTTLLRLVAGFESPDAGSVALHGRTIAGAGEWVPPEERHLGMVFQDYALFPHMTVLQNVAFGLKGRPKKAREHRAGDMLDMVSLSGMGSRYPYELSGGEQQRVALARSLAAEPRALLLDEPFSNLDPQLRAGLRSEVRSILRSSGVSAIYVTHDQEEALFMGDRVAVLNSGTLEQVGSPEEMFHHPRSRFVAGFLGTADFLPARSVGGCLETEIGLLAMPENLHEGALVDVVIRPDDVAMGRDRNGLGVVSGRVFRGTHYLYTVSLPSGIEVRSLQHHTAHYEDGEVVEVRLEPDQSLTCFPVDETVDTGLTARTIPTR